MLNIYRKCEFALPGAGFLAIVNSVLHRNMKFFYMPESPILEFRNLSKAYRVKEKYISVLKKISFKIDRGKIYGIIGRSGAGKSTLLRMINALERPDSGEVLVNGDDLSQLSLSSLRKKRKKIGLIFQHFNLISTKTVFENVALPLQFSGMKLPDLRSRVHELLDRVGLTGFSARYPEQLSGGQRQRVSIARSLATSPEILLCDEATSSLDPEATVSILKLLQSLNRELGISIVLITHEMSVIKSICHDVAVLNEGELIESGSVLTVFSNPKHEVTKTLIRKAFHLELPELFATKVQPVSGPGRYPLLRMTFVGRMASEPITVSLFEKFAVKINILLADVEYFCDTDGEVQVGFLLSQLVGESAGIELAIEYLRKNNINVEGVGYVAL